METDPAEQLQAKLDKLRRRQRRNERAAWAKGFLTAVCGMLKPGDLAIDCGANVGDVSAQLLTSGADVLAFEPEPWATEKLKERFSDNTSFHLVEAAVGKENGQVTLHRASNFESNERNASVKSTIYSGGRMIDDDGGVSVRLIDFREVLREELESRDEIAFVKMDIEGAELDVLEALHKDDLLGRIRCMVVETHERKFKELRPRYRKLREQFAQHYLPSHVNLDWI